MNSAWVNAWVVIGPVIGGVLTGLILRFLHLKPLFVLRCYRKELSPRQTEIRIAVEGTRKVVSYLSVTVCPYGEHVWIAYVRFHGDCGCAPGERVINLGKSKKKTLSLRLLYAGQKCEWRVELQGPGPHAIEELEVRTDAKYKMKIDEGIIGSL
jgi:hypothetical protein